MADRSDLPRPAPDIAEDGVPSVSEVREDVRRTGDTMEGESPPLDQSQGVEGHTTAADQRAGDSFRERVAREQPERWPADDHVGRQILEPGAGQGLTDGEADAVGEMDGVVEDTLSPEESAMRVEDDPGGLTDDAGPGYLDDEE